MSTNVQSGNALTNKEFNAALFVESARIPSLANLLSDGKPTLGSQGKKAAAQSGAGAPIVRVDDLSKEMGDEVTMDLFHQLNQKPVMGDDKLAGKGASLRYASFSLKIDQGRTMVDSGGKMSQQRTKHDLKKVAHTMLTPYYGRLEDQLCLAHLAGARGDHAAADWILPLESDPDFARICVNPILPPTYDRHMFAGDATAIDGGGAIDATDTMDLASIDNLRLFLDEMAYPLQPIRYKGDSQNEDNPFYVLQVTPRQWKDIHDASTGAQLRTLQSNAIQRSKGFDHPLFRGDVLMWNNILIRKQRRPIRFETGSTVNISNNDADATAGTAVAAVPIERAILLGAQALANAFGRSGGKGSLPFAYNTEDTDHKNVVEHSVAWMNGKSKIRFRGTDGRVNDHGVIVMDSAVN